MPELDLSGLSSYLEHRKAVFKERDTFLLAAKTYLAREQRPHAGDLNEPRWNHPARQFKSDDWLLNSTRGYLVLREDRTSRPFRLAVEQPGNSLVLEVSVVDDLGGQSAQSKLEGLAHRLAGDHMGEPTIYHEFDAGLERWYCRWQLEVPELYTSVRAIENAHFMIWRVFDAAVIKLIPA